MRERSRYAPRVDIAVGPFNTTPGRDPEITSELLPKRVRALFNGDHENRNPRCLLAIEVCFSGSSKHVLGDILNAGALGLYGLVVGREENMAKIRRNFEYLRALAELEKLPWLFRNVAALSADEFDTLFRATRR